MIKKNLFFLLSLVAFAIAGYGFYVYFTQDGVEQPDSNALSSNKVEAGDEISAGVNDGNSLAKVSRGTAADDGSAPAARAIDNQQSGSDGAAEHAAFEAADERYTHVNENTRYPKLQNRIEELESLYPHQSFEPNQLVDLLAEPNAWQKTDLPAQQLPLTEVERNDGREFIELKPERLLVALPGDSLELPIEQLGLNLEMQVERREELPNGGFVLHGRVLGTDELMRVTLTQTPGLSLAGIETPQGHYVLQANDGHGWIASSDTLFKQDEHQNDMVIPPEN